MKRLTMVPAYTGAGIYSITCKSNGKVYVGSAVSVRGRLIVHRQSLIRGDHYNRYLQRAWNKYGEERFRFDILEKCPASKVLQREGVWIRKLGKKHTEEHKAKISAGGKKAWEEYRRKWYETREQP